METILDSVDKLVQTKNLEDAKKLVNQVLNKEPDNPRALYLLGQILILENCIDDALGPLLKAVTSNQAQPCWHILCGIALEKKGYLLEAQNSYHLGEALGCTNIQMYYLLGEFYSNTLPDYEKSELYYAYLIKNYPDEIMAYLGLSKLYINQKRYEEAIQALDVCLTNGFERTEVYINLGHALSHQGRQKDALTCTKKAFELDPNNIMTCHNYILQLMCTLDDQAELYHEIKNITSIYNESEKSVFTGPLDCTHGRKLNLGFVSADLRKHAITHYFLPVYRHLDKSLFSIHIYYNEYVNDQYTEEYKSRADTWCYIKDLTDENLADQIRADKIDILVDLSNHTSGSRLSAFIKKPAPMQVSLMGIPITTGLKCIDFSIKERSLIKLCDLDKNSTEKILPMDNTAYYNPLCELPPTAKPPCLKNGFITYGSFNALRKIDITIFGIWSKILQAVPNSKLKIIIEDESNPLMRDYIHDQFKHFGIDKPRIILQPKMNTTEYFASHNLVDIALDPYPYHGETTTYNSLLMGLPIVSRIGKTEVSNISTRILTAINKQEWLANNFEEYVEIAANLAMDTDNLVALRKTLRGEVENSSIMDYEGAARRIETALLAGWEETCKKYN